MSIIRVWIYSVDPTAGRFPPALRVWLELEAKHGIEARVYTDLESQTVIFIVKVILFQKLRAFLETVVFAFHWPVTLHVILYFVILQEFLF
jgi:hypothetical protein